MYHGGQVFPPSTAGRPPTAAASRLWGKTHSAVWAVGLTSQPPWSFWRGMESTYWMEELL